MEGKAGFIDRLKTKVPHSKREIRNIQRETIEPRSFLEETQIKGGVRKVEKGEKKECKGRFSQRESNPV